MKSVAVMITALFCSTVTLGQDGASTSGSSDEPDELLAGPQVDEEAADATNATMAGSRKQNQRRLQRPTIGPRIWIRELRQFDLSEAQRATFEAIVAEYEQAQREHVAQYGPELRELAKQNRENRRGDMEAAKELRDRMQTLRALGPQFDEYQRRIWDELTVAQRDALTEQLEAVQKQIEAEREGRRSRSRGSDDRRTATDRDTRRAGVNSPSLDAFDELSRRRLNFLIEHKKAGTLDDLDIQPRRRLPPPPPRQPSTPE